jgi:hypothetical protein
VCILRMILCADGSRALWAGVDWLVAFGSLVIQPRQTQTAWNLVAAGGTEPAAKTFHRPGIVGRADAARSRGRICPTEVRRLCNEKSCRTSPRPCVDWLSSTCTTGCASSRSGSARSPCGCPLSHSSADSRGSAGPDACRNRRAIAGADSRTNTRADARRIRHSIAGACPRAIAGAYPRTNPRTHACPRNRTATHTSIATDSGLRPRQFCCA